MKKASTGQRFDIWMYFRRFLGVCSSVRLFIFETRVHPRMKVYFLILMLFQTCVTLFSLKHKKRYFEMCLSVVFFFHPNHESQWGLWLFWTSLTFITWTKTVLFCSTKEKKARFFPSLNHSEGSEIHTAALNHIVRTKMRSFSCKFEKISS